MSGVFVTAGYESKEASYECKIAVEYYLQSALEFGMDSDYSIAYKEPVKSHCDAGYPCVEFQKKYDKCVGVLGEHPYCSFLEELVRSHCNTGEPKSGKKSTSGAGIKSTNEDSASW